MRSILHTAPQVLSQSTEGASSGCRSQSQELGALDGNPCSVTVTDLMGLLLPKPGPHPAAGSAYIVQVEATIMHPDGWTLKGEVITLLPHA